MKIRILFFVFFVCSLLPATQNKVTTELNGVELIYTYSGGMSFRLKYTASGVMYQFLSGDSPSEWWGPFPYKAFKTDNGEFFLGWYEKGHGDQITQLVNLEKKILYGSGIIVKNKRVIEHFQNATIEKISGWK